MTDLIRAELLKLRTTRTFWWTVAATSPSSPSASPWPSTASRRSGDAALDSSEGVRNVFAAASSGGVVVLLIGILSWPASSASTRSPRRS